MAENFEWIDSYAVGVEQFDDDHKTLIRLVNDTVNALHEGQGRQTIEDILDSLIEYTVCHFDLEESLMEETEYPGFKKHKDCHNELIRQVLKYGINIRRNEVNPVEVGIFLADWLISHIQQEDKKYQPHFRSKGIA